MFREESKDTEIDPWIRVEWLYENKRSEVIFFSLL
jgi:hypothetical protein